MAKTDKSGNGISKLVRHTKINTMEKSYKSEKATRVTGLLLFNEAFSQDPGQKQMARAIRVTESLIEYYLETWVGLKNITRTGDAPCH